MSHRAISRENRLLPSNERHRNVYTLTKGIRSTQHIPNLPNDKHAEAMLERLRREFHPLAQARGYTIPTLTEMCCCSDGIHHYKTTTTKTTSTGRTITRTKKVYGRRRFRRMSNNVQGYNYGNGRGGKHEIHLRLRRPSSHTFYSYEHVAGVMIHELTHCEIGPHSAAFYELMDDIAEQFNRYLEKGIVVDKQGFPLLQDQAYRLGGIGGRSGTARIGTTERAKSGNISATDTNRGRNGDATSLGEIVQERKRARQAETAAAKRNQRKGHKLGTGPSSLNDANNQLTLLPNGTLGRGAWKKLTPREAALRAAERRLQDAVWCLPCDEAGEILDLTSETSSDDETDDEHLVDNEGHSDAVVEDERKKAGIGNAHDKEDDSEVGSGHKYMSNAEDNSTNKTNNDEDERDQNKTRASSASTSSKTKNQQIPRSPFQANSRAKADNSSADVIDLTLDEDLGGNNILAEVSSSSTTTLGDSSVIISSVATSSTALFPIRRRRRPPLTTVQPNAEKDAWSCQACTFQNPTLLHLSCGACGTPRVNNDESKLLKLQKALYNKDAETLSKKTAEKLIRDDAIERQKEYEHKRSEKEFGGFNIYGTKKQNTRTMGHIT